MPEDALQNAPESVISSPGVAGGLEIFRAILAARDPAGFSDFRSGIIDRDEGYKVRNHAEAIRRLGLSDWDRLTPGTGQILARVISAIEIQEDKAKGISQNNVLMWWPPSVAHRRLLDIRSEGGAARTSLERHLRDLYLNTRPEAEIFEDLAQQEMLGRSYPLLAYLFFLKDIERFVPVTPGGLQKGLVEIGADLTLVRRCSWENYQHLILRLQAVRRELASQIKTDVRLIDAHSFVWVIGAWERPDDAGRVAHKGGTLLTAAKDKAHRRMVLTIQDTVRNANGQLALRRVKDKITDMTPAELDAYVAELMEEGRKCKLTGCEMLYDGEPRTPFEKNFLVSADRIDSDRGYVRGNIQLICQFANFFKGARYTDAVFQQLIESIRAVDSNDDGPVGP